MRNFLDRRAAKENHPQPNGARNPPLGPANTSTPIRIAMVLCVCTLCLPGSACIASSQTCKECKVCYSAGRQSSVVVLSNGSCFRVYLQPCLFTARTHVRVFEMQACMVPFDADHVPAGSRLSVAHFPS